MDGSPLLDAWDREAVRYDSEFNDARSRAEDEIVNRWARAPQFASLVDIGCGTGYYLDHGFHGQLVYQGVDFSTGMIRRARDKWPQYDFALGDAVALPLPDGRYRHAVALWGVFSYCAERFDAFLEARRVLMTGGTLRAMVCTPRYGRRRPHGRLDVPAHVSFYSRRDAEVFAVSAGFDGVKVRGLAWQVWRIARWLPDSWTQALVRLEYETVGRWRPDWCRWLLIEGRARA